MERAVVDYGIESPNIGSESMWAVVATRTVNKGTRYENTVTVPTFYLDPRLQGVRTRTDARAVAAIILGADQPHTDTRFEVHLVG